MFEQIDRPQDPPGREPDHCLECGRAVDHAHWCPNLVVDVDVVDVEAER